MHFMEEDQWNKQTICEVETAWKRRYTIFVQSSIELLYPCFLFAFNLCNKHGKPYDELSSSSGNF